MKVSKKSFHWWLYKFTYSKYDRHLPTNLCPYFWKLVWAFVILIPNSLLQLPKLIMGLVNRKYLDTCGENRGIGLGIYIILGLGAGYILLWVHWIAAIFKLSWYFQDVANVAWVLHAVVALIIVVYYIRKWVLRKRQGKEKHPSIILEFIKAKYNRFCPILDWTESETKENKQT